MKHRRILFFNLQRLEEGTGANYEYLVIALYKHYKGKVIPRTALDKFKPIPGIGCGSSFIRNPSRLFNDKSVDIVHKAQYIRLAGRRDYFDYKFLNSSHLDLDLYPDLNLKAIAANPLLTIIDKKLIFKYEE